MIITNMIRVANPHLMLESGLRNTRDRSTNEVRMRYREAAARQRALYEREIQGGV